MNKPYIYLAISKKVSLQYVNELIEILHGDYGVPKDQIKMHLRGASYNAKKAKEAALVIGVSHNSSECPRPLSINIKFPKGSYGELYNAVDDARGNNKLHLIYDRGYDDFFAVYNTGAFNVINEHDWSDKYGLIHGRLFKNSMQKLINNRVMKYTESEYDDETSGLDLIDETFKSDDQDTMLLLLTKN